MRGFRKAIELCGRTAAASEESVAGDEKHIVIKKLVKQADSTEMKDVGP